MASALFLTLVSTERDCKYGYFIETQKWFNFSSPQMSFEVIMWKLIRTVRQLSPYFIDYWLSEKPKN